MVSTGKILIGADALKSFNNVERGVRYNTTFARIYRNEDAWRSTDSFSRDDLLLLAKVADMAHSWIFQQTKNPGHTADEQSAVAYRYAKNKLVAFFT